MTVIPTKYQHNWDAEGRPVMCYGRLMIICKPGRPVYVRCDLCGNGYMFDYQLGKVKL